MECYPDLAGCRLRLSCFFCLRSNSRKYLNPPDESESVCGNAEEDAVSSFHEFSLRNLYRYLNLLHSDKEETDFRDLKMPICEECFRLNGEFNKLYDLLEETKLRLNWYIQKLEVVMTKGGNVVQAMELEENEVDDEKIMEIWRTHTLDRMKAFTSASFPRVLLFKNQRKRVFPWIKEEEETVKMRIKDEKVISTSTLGVEALDQKMMTFSPPSMFADHHPFEDSQAKVTNLDDIFQHPSPPVISKMQRFPENNDIDIHMECDAKPYMLRTGYDDEENDEEGGSTLKEETKVEARSRFRSRGRPAYMSKFIPVSKNGGKVRCKSCNKSLNRNKAFHHWKYDCANGLRHQLISKDSMSSKKCTYCSHVCGADIRGRWASMLRHKVRFHPEYYLLNETERNEAAGFRPERFLQILEDVVFPKFVKRGEGYASCSLCAIQYQCNSMTQNVGSIKQHLIYQHRAELREDLKIVQEDPRLVEVIPIPKEISRGRGGARKRIKYKYSSDCPYCSYKTAFPVGSSYASNAMTGHLTRCHPEHFLINEKDKASGLWHDKFPAILTHLIYPKFILNEGHHRSCSLCGKTWKYDAVSMNVQMLKRHLIFHHKLELKEKLKVVLEDSTLEEKLISCSNLDKAKGRVPVRRTTYCKTGEKFTKDCQYCQFKCSAKEHVVWDTMVKHHVQLHPEHFLLDKKERDQSTGFRPKQFQKILTGVVLSKFVRKSGHQTWCSLCGAKYQCNKVQLNVLLVRKHLMFNHKTEVKKELGVVMEDPLLGEKLKEITNTKVRSTPKVTRTEERKSSSKCAYCRFQCSSSRNLQISMERHIVRFHPEHFLMDEDMPTLMHPQFQRILSEMVFPKFVRITGTGKHTKCSLCKVEYTVRKKYDNISSVKKHVLLEHKAELKESINDVMEDPQLAKKLAISKANGVTCSCGVYFVGSNYHSRIRYHEKFHCRECGTSRSYNGNGIVARV